MVRSGRTPHLLGIAAALVGVLGGVVERVEGSYYVINGSGVVVEQMAERAVHVAVRGSEIEAVGVGDTLAVQGDRERAVTQRVHAIVSQARCALPNHGCGAVVSGAGEAFGVIDMMRSHGVLLARRGSLDRRGGGGWDENAVVWDGHVVDCAPRASSLPST